MSAKKGIFKLLKSKGLSDKETTKCIDLYSLRYVNFRDKSKNPDIVKTKLNRRFAMECISESQSVNFNKFLSIVTEETGVQFKKNTSIINQ